MAPRTRTRTRTRTRKGSTEIATQHLRARKRISYRESDSTSDVSDLDFESSLDRSASDNDHQPRSKPSSTPSPSRCLRRSSNKRRAPPATANARLTRAKRARSNKTLERGETHANGGSNKSLECDETDVNEVLELGQVPPWQSLPYHILLQIFLFASPQLWTEDFVPTASVPWLLKCALLCRSFAEPALSALYYSPPLTPPTRARGLIQCLASQTESSAFNYRSKVKYLDVEADITLWRKYKGRDPINLGDLVYLTPKLRGLRIHVAPFNLRRNSTLYANSSSKAIYQKWMFAALQTRGIALREWIWNAELAGQRYLVPRLGEIHSTSAFQSLRTLTLIKYDEKGCTEEQLADAIKTLPQLKRLVFRLSLIVNQKLLPLLPPHLESLEIVKCSSLTSPMLSQFLFTHGQELLELILDHNQALNLSFLTGFAIACPKIQTLGMNLRFYNSHSAFPDLDPKFDALLGEDETPTWPASLASIELLHLRKWNLNVAERFFSSLLDSAISLPKLRRLNIKASLEESGWRDRVSFRDKWTSTLKQVFLRVSEPPSPHLKSLAAFKLYKDQLLARNGSVEDDKLETKPKQQRKQCSKFSHVEISNNVPRATAYDESDSDNSHGTIRRSRRLKQRDMTKRTWRTKRDPESDGSLSSGSGNDDEDEYVSPKPSPSLYRRRPRRRRKDASGESSSSEDSALDDDAAGEQAPEEIGRFQRKDDSFYIQGMCDVVHVLVDNLRPNEELLNESHFLDDERSGDEDWDGKGVADEEGYAW